MEIIIDKIKDINLINSYWKMNNGDTVGTDEEKYNFFMNGIKQFLEEIEFTSNKSEKLQNLDFSDCEATTIINIKDTLAKESETI